MEASQLSRTNFALELPRPVELMRGKAGSLAMWKWEGGNGGWARGGYKIDDVSTSVIRNTFIPFVSLHWLVESIYIYIYIRYFHERTQLRYRLGGYSISALKFSNVPLLLRGDTTTSRNSNGLLYVERTWTKFSLRRKTSLTLWPIDKNNENTL